MLESATQSVNWLKRNWKWAIPVFMVTTVVGAGTIVFSALAIVKASGAYQLAVETATTNPAVEGLLGVPVEADFWVTGSASSQGDRGGADLRIPLNGRRDSGTLRVRAERVEDRWHFYEAVLVAPEGEVDLTEDLNARAVGESPRLR